MSIQHISPTRLRKRLNAANDPPLLLDVREPSERAHCHIAGSLHIPMSEIASRLAELPPDAEIVVICHHGMRSMQVASFLGQHGYSHLFNLVGGIDAWSTEVDPSIPRY